MQLDVLNFGILQNNNILNMSDQEYQDIYNFSYDLWNTTDLYDFYDEAEDVVIVKKPFAFKSIIAVIAIITNLAILLVLVFHLVKDIHQQKGDNARWPKRHVLILMCGFNIAYLILTTIITESSATYAWYHQSVSMCRTLFTFTMSLETLKYVYSVVLAVITIIQVLEPTFLVGTKQNIFWFLMHVLIVSFVLVFYGILTATSYELKTFSYRRDAICIYTGPAKFWIFHLIGFGLLPIALVLLASIIAVVIYILKPSQNIPSTNSNKMLRRIISSQSQSILFLVIFGVFMCGTCLPLLSFQLKLSVAPDTGYNHKTRLQKMRMLLILYNQIFRLLFPLCCLILDETWLCSTIDKRFCNKNRVDSNVITEVIDEEDHELEQLRSSSE